MEKLVVLIRRSLHQDRSSFQRWYLTEFAPLAFANNKNVRMWTVNVVDRDPSELAPYDIVSELRGNDLECSELHSSLATGEGAVFSYRVEELIEKSAAPKHTLSGIKMIGCMLPLPHLDSIQERNYWNRHVALALEVHVGVTEYVRNWVIHSLCGDAPAYFGFCTLYFPTERDFGERYFNSDEGRRLHGTDIAQFVGPTVKLLTSEYVLNR